MKCEIVSERLTQAVAANGGKLSKLRMTHGNIGRNPVICYINNSNEQCNSKNLLLTLNQSDRGKESQILQQLVTFGIQGTGPTLTRGRAIINLGIEVENALGVGGAAESPNTTTSVTQPQQPVPSPVPSAAPSTLPSTRPSTIPSTAPSVDNSL